MPIRNHDPTNDDMPAFSTSATLRSTLEALKEEEDFCVTVEIGGETDASQAIPPG